MKKRMISIAVIAVFLTVMFTACGDVETVITYKKASKPSKVEAKILNSRWVLVTWKAAKNGISYNVYFRKDNTNTIISSGTGTNASTYLADGQLLYQTITNNDPDTWSAVVPILPLTTSGANNLNPGSSYKFGVRTNDIDANNRESDLSWSKSLAISTY